ncbi:hypothetical protein BDV33DRAFT_229091 [Aspergillus novoparasiticus]|uniref:Uncharacterized protein n=1 Tax=Aspergillus novoparasiticus TaxID=986946 RepID=A0A5N6E8F2_9EURO|nr:hypothetical protein BDV33DRAFT_229091 [Aspergillus novoparasiticus]
MNALIIYAIVAGGIFAVLFLARIASSLTTWAKSLDILLFGLWSRGSVLLHLSYISTSIFLVFFGDTSNDWCFLSGQNSSYDQFDFPLSTIKLSYLADVLGITLKNFQRAYRVVGWTTVALQGASSLGILAALSLPWFRKWAYEIFLQLHQLLAGVYILFYRNGLFAWRGCPRAILSCSEGQKTREGRDDLSDTAIKIHIILPRSVKDAAGQYINLWMPTVSLMSWAETHPFTVMSWTRGKQDTLDLRIQPRRGLSAKFLQHIRPVAEGSGFGIAAVIPHVKEMICGYNTCTSHIRRLHLVWQVESIGGIIASRCLLIDDVMDDGYILNIYICVEKDQLIQSKQPLARMKGLFFYQGIPDYRAIIASEVSSDLIEILPNIRDERGEALVIVSAREGLRDLIREITRKHLHQRVRFAELEYQPSSG